jgi:hypothetical protein
MPPKIKVSWRGDSILVTKLIADHHKKKKKGPLVVNENGCASHPVATFFRSMNVSSHAEPSKTGGNLDAVGGAGNSNHQPTNDHCDDEDKITPWCCFLRSKSSLNQGEALTYPLSE